MKNSAKRIKAIFKILTGVILASFLGAFFSFLAVIFSINLGVVAVALGISIMLIMASLGAWFGSKWALKDVSDLKDARIISMRSALLFLVFHLILFAVAGLFAAGVGEKGLDFGIQAIQVGAQSFAIYASSYISMRRGLIKNG